MIKNAITWFEIPVFNFERAQKFYSTIFNSEMSENTMGGSRMGFFVCDFEAGGIGGAIVQGDGYVPSDIGSLVYFFTGVDLNAVL
jgi:predicted enzyme related to lactoylglutathione lyase